MSHKGDVVLGEKKKESNPLVYLLWYSSIKINECQCLCAKGKKKFVYNSLDCFDYSFSAKSKFKLEEV